MKVHFFKYQATGNDFVIIDNRSGAHSFSADQVKAICDRRFGVGADGLMLIERHPLAHFHLRYYNSDGSQSLCGNGSRAAVNMAGSLGMVNGKATFEAYDGMHDAEILEGGIVRLKMNDVAQITATGEDYFVHTGSPHYVRFVDDVRQYPVYQEGKEIRYSAAYSPGGTNVNFVQVLGNNTIFVRTYERGVENETLSCGTGVTAAALSSKRKGLHSPVSVKTLGGDLQVEYKTSHSGTITDIYLTGPAKLVFEGDLEL